MATKESGLRLLSIDWTYNGGDKTIPVPDGWMVIDVILNIQTTINGDTPAAGTVSVGITGTTDALVEAESAQGYYRSRGGGQANESGVKLTTEDILVDVTPNNADAGAGEVYVLLAPVVS